MGLLSFWDSSLDIPDLTGKVALVTGANAGMGYMIAEQLALHGAKVWMGARSEAKAKEAINKYNADNAKKSKRGEIVWLPLDLTLPVDVVKSAKLFLSSSDRLDILVNNAARMASPYILTENGLETSVAINHVGHFALTEALLPILEQTTKLPGADVRIVTVSSDLHTYIKNIKVDTKDDFNVTFASDPASNDSLVAKNKRYAFTKVLNVLFASELQRRVDQRGVPIISISLHPGVVATGGALDLFPGWLSPILRLIGKSPLQGSISALFAATAPEVRVKAVKYRGAYLGPGGKMGVASETARDEKLAKQLWALTEETVKTILEK